VDLCEAAEAALLAVAAVDVGSLPEASVADRLPWLFRMRAVLDAAIIDTVGVFDGRKQYAYDGAFSTSSWIAARADVTRASASATVKVARQARHMKHSMEAARAGDLGFDKLRVLAAARGVSETTESAFDGDEERLVGEVQHRDVETGARLMRGWAAAADPDADDVKYDEREQKRKVNLSTSLDGMGFLDGLLTSEANAVLRSELESITDDLHRWGLGVDAEGRRLTAAQLRHDALVEMARRAGASATIVQIRRGARQRAAEHGAEDDTRSADPTDGPAGDSDIASRDSADDPGPVGSPSGPTVTDTRAEAGASGATDTADAADGSPCVDDEGRPATSDGDQAEGDGVNPDPGPGPDRASPLFGPDDLDGDPLEPIDDGHDGCSHETGAEGFLRPPGHSPPADKVAGGLGRPLVGVLVDLDTLEGRSPPDRLGRVAEIIGTGPVPDGVIRRFLCDAGVSRIVTHGRSLPLDVGAVSRTAPPAHWRALIAHAGGCEFPGCSAPWEWCEAHHITPWSDEHRTALDGLALGCNGHHKLVHKPGWSMTRLPDLTIEVTRPDGTALTV